jgi:ABC-type uncharacterized transport system permease subunit
MASATALAFTVYGAPSKAEATRGRQLSGLLLGGGALAMHAALLWRNLFARPDVGFTAADTASLIALIIAMIAIIACLARPAIAGAGAVLLGLAGFIAATTDVGTQAPVVGRHDWKLVAHIVLSTLAFAFITVGAALAVVLTLLDRRLRARRPLGWLAILPPVDTLERSMFQSLSLGLALLSLALFSGFIFIENLFAQELVQKTVLSCLAWVMLAILLFGRWRFGWRGRTALQWTMGGYLLLGLAYFGSKVFLESMGKHWG